MWELYQAEAFGETFTATELGMTWTVNMKDDYTWDMTVISSGVSETGSGTWERINDNTVRLDDLDDTIELIKDGENYKTTITQDGVTMTLYFAKS